MPSIRRTAASALLALLCAGCALVRTPEVTRVALLAPFEGRYRDIGYNALYAARLGILAPPANIDLLAVDDGGTAEVALRHAQALARDPSLIGVVLIGPFSTAESVQRALAPLPAIIVGSWGVSPISGVAQLAPAPPSAGYADERVDTPAAPLGQRFVSPGLPPADDYEKRYRALGQFSPPPNTLAMLTTDAVGLLIARHQQGVPWQALAWAGLSGTFQFDDAGHWRGAALHLYEVTQDSYRRVDAP